MNALSKFVRRTLLASASAGAVCLSSAANAGQASDQAVELQESQGQARGEPSDNIIIVTAAKRDQTLAEVPISVSVVGAEEIANSEIEDILDLQVRVPSLQVNQLNLSSQTNFVIRGFGNGANNVGVEPAVGFFVDNVYRSRTSSGLSDFIDVERVEVLRGPQSTLFGKNASAGVVSVITKRPKDSFEGDFEASYGNFDTFKLAGTVSGPLGEGVSARVSASMNKRDGFIENISDGADLNDRNRWGIRGKLLFEASPAIDILLSADYERSRELCCGITNLVAGPTVPVIEALGGTLVTEDPFAYQTSLTSNPENENDLFGVSAQIDFDAGIFDVISITAFRRADTLTSADVDVTDVEIIQPNVNDIDIETFTQEIRLTSKDNGGPLSWFLGGFYFEEKITNTDVLIWGDAARPYVDTLLGASGASLGLLELLTGSTQGSFFARGQGLNEISGQSNKAYSIFGVVDLDIVDRLTLTVGASYTNDKKDVFHRIVSTDAYSQTDLNPLIPLIGPVAVATLQSLQIFPEFLNYPNAVEDGKSRDDKFTYSARLSYDLTNEVNVFASFATGFKATSWNLSRDSRPLASDFPAIADAGLLTTNLNPGTRFARPENSEVFEVGVKGFWDNFQFSATYFDQKIEDFQTFVFLGAGFGLSNAEQRSAKGFEYDFRAQLTDQLSFWSAGTFIDPVYGEFTASAFGDISGTRPSQIPGTAIALGANYEFEIGKTLLNLQADYQYQSDTDFEDDPTLQTALSAYSNAQNLVNASITAEFENGIRARLWARNLMDDKYLVNFAFPTPLQGGSYSGLPALPRTYGVTVGVSF